MFAQGTQRSICTITVWNKPESGKVRHCNISAGSVYLVYKSLFLECWHISLICPGLKFSQHLIHRKGFLRFAYFPSITTPRLKAKETFSYKIPPNWFYMLIYSHTSLKYLLSHSCSGRVESAPCGFLLNVTKTQPCSCSSHFWQDANPHSINMNMHLHSV